MSRTKKHFLKAGLITSVSGSLGLLGIVALLRAEDGLNTASGGANHEVPVFISTGPSEEAAPARQAGIGALGAIDGLKLKSGQAAPKTGESAISYDVPVVASHDVPLAGMGMVSPAAGEGERRRMALRPNFAPAKSDGMAARRANYDIPLFGSYDIPLFGEAASGDPEPETALHWGETLETGAGSAHAGGRKKRAAANEEVAYRRTDRPTDGEISDLAGNQRLETMGGGGYFPTASDHFYIGDYDYPRSYGPDSHEWPDLHLQRSMGMYAYDDPDVSFYDEHSSFYDPLDRTLGFFTPHEGLVLGSEQLDAWSFALDADIPMFTRGFEPDKAHVKAGPLYVDLMSLGGGVLYSDYSGQENFKEGEEDGWLSFLELQARVLLRISENIYLAAGGRLIFLPGEGKLAFRLGGDYGPNGIARLNYQARLGQWDVLFYDDLRSRYGSDLLNSGAIDRAGRYQFGFSDSHRGHDMFQGDGFHLLNQVGIKASRPVEDWRLWLDANHQDRWLGYDFEDHGSRERASAMLSYEGAKLPFSPYLLYEVDSVDEFDTFHNRVYLGGSGRVTENLSIDGRVGYLWTENRVPDREWIVWNLGLTHDLSERTRHGLRVGQDYVSDDFTGDTAVADYLRYDIGHRITSVLYARAYAQWSSDEHLGRPEFSGDRELYGGSLSYRPGGYTDITLGAYYDRWDTTEESERERTLYFAHLNQRIASRTTLWFRYQFEDYETFDEHLYMTGVRKYF